MPSMWSSTRSVARSVRCWLALALLSAAAIAAFPASPAQASEAAFPTLHHGVNLSNWFTDYQRQPLVQHDFEQIKAAGFDHVRIPINPELLGFSVSEASTGRVLFDFSDLDAAVNMARDHGLSVILDIHPSDAFMTDMEQDPRTEPALIALWHKIAEHYSTYSTSTVVFELLNEPRYVGNTTAYRNMMSDIVSALRDVAPKTRMIVDMPNRASVDGFAGFTPLGDGNVDYAFHFYDPYIITHQGMKVASSFGRGLRYFRNLPYPSSAVDPKGKYAPNAADSIEAMKSVSDYVAASWDAAHIAARIKIAADWAANNHAHLICSEFGAARKGNPPASRYQWITDTRKALDKAGIGWAVWDYTDLFGITQLTGDTIAESDGALRLADPAQGSRDIEPEAIKALFAN